jgi:RNA polymerase sigma-70 factor, ECF subfamily
VALTNLDRVLLDKCLTRDSDAWRDFADRFLGLVIHVVNLTAESRNIQITPESRDDLVSEVFLALLDKDFAVLRRFRGQSSLATYLTVIARRVIVRRLSHLRTPVSMAGEDLDQFEGPTPRLSLEEREQLENSLGKLEPNEEIAIRMFHLDGRSYQEIGDKIGMPINSIGPFLTRARDKLKAKSTIASN